VVKPIGSLYSSGISDGRSTAKYDLVDLSQNNSYTIKMISTYPDNHIYTSNSLFFYTEGPPQNVRLISITDQSATVSYQPSFLDSRNYSMQLVYSTDTTNTSPVYTWDSTNNLFVVNNLLENTDYMFEYCPTANFENYKNWNKLFKKIVSI
jgi:hypothetical protein